MRADEWIVYRYGERYKVVYFKSNSGGNGRKRKSELQQLHDFYENSPVVAPVGRLQMDEAYNLWNNAFNAHERLEIANAKKAVSFSKILPPSVENPERFSNSISRAKARIFEYAMCNEFTHFVTLTQDGGLRNRYDLKQYVKDFGQMVRDINKQSPHNRLSYVLVPEYHADGAVHMHGLIMGLDSRLYINEHNKLDWRDYRKKFGFCCIEPIRDKNACSAYMTKYVTKDLAKTVSEKGAHLFYASHGLNGREVVSKILDCRCPVDFDYENDYVKIAWLSADELAELTF